MNLDEIGPIIRQTRKSRGWIQQSLAAHLRMSRATISGIENGTIPEIGIRKIISICDSLGLELIIQPKPPRPTLPQLIKESEEADRILAQTDREHQKRIRTKQVLS